MRKKLSLQFIMIVAFTLCVNNIVAQKVFLPHYTTKDGLPSNLCFYTLQDKKGFLWVATDAGVSRFDGAVFENFTIEDGLPDNQILQLHEDSNGRLWFLAFNGQLSFFQHGKIYNKENFKPLANLNFTGVVVSFFEDSQQRIWFGTNNNTIGMWDGKNTLKFSGTKVEDNYQNSFIYEDNSKNIWAINKFGNFIFSKDKFLVAEKSIVPRSQKSIRQHINKSIYFIDKRGLSVKKGNKLEQLLPLSDKLLGEATGYIYVDDQALWLSGPTGVNVRHYNRQVNTLLNGVDVSQIIKDKTGNMWFTTTNGLYKLPHIKDQLYYYQPKNSMPYSYKSITKDPYGRLWLGANSGSIKILDLNTWETTSVNIPEPSSFNTIKQFALDKKNNKIFFASDYGIGAVSAAYPKIKNFKFLREINDHFFAVKSFAIDTTNKLSLSMSSGVLTVDREKLAFSSLNYKEQNNFFKNRSYRVFYDQAQNLWFSNISGLTEVGQQKITEHFKSNPLLTKRINDIVALGDDMIALATDGYGVFLLKDGKIIHTLNRKNGLHNNIVNKLFVKGDKLWALSSNGVNCVELNNKELKIRAFDDINSQVTGNLNDIFIDRDTAYLATDNGLFYFVPNRSLQRIKPPAVFITGLLHNHKQLRLEKKIFTFKPNDQEITINYAAVDFKNKNISYRYKLKSTNNWVETKNRRLALSSLPPGTYDFEISAKNQNSEWGPPAQIRLILMHRFYQTWWFITLVVLAGAYSIYKITVTVTKRNKNKEQEELLLKHKILMLEQKALQAMMNPHFVFNVMNSIQHYINTNNTNSANKILSGFARLIRKNLEMCTQSYISLADEISYLELYLSLEQNRFGDKLKYEINLPDNIDRDETEIPSMLLQPYIENAIWHGIMPQELGGKVTITIVKKDSDTLLIQIEDNGVGIDNSLKNKKGDHQSKGMMLISERINLLNQIEAVPIQLNVAQNGKKGTIISISIPILE